MTMDYDHGFDEGEEGTKGLVGRKSISPSLAITIAHAALDQAREAGFPKVAVCIMGVERFPLVILTAGLVLPSTVTNAINKAMTPLLVGRSTQAQKEIIQRGDINRADYGTSIRTLFGGGGLLYEDEAKTKIVGSIGISGARSERDDIDCYRAAVANASELVTD